MSKIKNKQSYITIGLVFPVILGFFIQFSIMTEWDEKFSAIADSFTSSSNPNQNNGQNFFLFVGDHKFDNTTETYIKFPIPNQDFKKVYIDIYWNSSTYISPMNICVSLIENGWDENIITWNNAPPKLVNDCILITGIGDLLAIDVTNPARGKTEISICIYESTPNTNDKYLYGIATGGGGINPRIIFFYDGISLGEVGGIIFLSILSVLVGLASYQKYKIMLSPEVPKSVMDKKLQSKLEDEKLPKFCPYCGIKLSLGSWVFCINCGNKLD